MPFAHPKIYTTPEGELWFKETSELWPGEGKHELFNMCVNVLSAYSACKEGVA
jgi:hypothetical protein